MCALNCTCLLFQCALGDLREEIQEQCKNPSTNITLLSTACEMVTVMDKVEKLLK